MAAAARDDWRSRPPHMYPNPYDSYYGNDEGSTPSYAGSYYGTPRSGGTRSHPPPPPHSTHSRHSPMVSRSDSDFFFHELPHSRSMSPGPPLHGAHPYEHPPAVATTPYRSGGQSYRSQIIHRGTPPYSSRGASSSALGTPRSRPTPQRSYADARMSGLFPDSPFSPRRGQTPMSLSRASRFTLPLHRQHLPFSKSAGPAPWEPPSPEPETPKQERVLLASEGDVQFDRTLSIEEESEEGDDEDKGGDPLALLAKVSSDMETKPGQSSKRSDAVNKPVMTSAPPTSPLRRTARSSPVITPTTDNTSTSRRKPEVQIHPSFPEVPAPPRSRPPPPVSGPKAVTPMPPYYPPYEDPRGPPPSYHYSGPPPSRSGPPYHPYPPPPHHSGPVHPSWRDPNYKVAPVHLAVVERQSFDSHESAVTQETSLRSSRRYFSQPPPPGPGAYPHPQEWPGTPPPTRPSGHPYPPRYMYGPPPPQAPIPREPYHAAPYSYVQQPAVEEKTVLRRKFSWKHYPELENFLIAHRDEYLEHSSKNYTAEQKQYNNWLTEQLLAVAERHGYTFDPEDFNFVSIRDRIRCYYKSFVQTARKRGLELPGKAHIKKHRPANSLDKYAEEKNKKLQEQHDDDKNDGNTPSAPRDKQIAESKIQAKK